MSILRLISYSIQENWQNSLFHPVNLSISVEDLSDTGDKPVSKITNIIVSLKKTWKFLSKYGFEWQALFAWSVLCLPQNVLTYFIYNNNGTSSLNTDITKLKTNATNVTYSCYENFEDWDPIVKSAKFYIQGIR